MPILLPLFVVGAICAPALLRRGRGGFAVLAIVPGVAFLWACTLIPRIMRGEVYEVKIPWVPQLGLNLDFYIDTLGLLLTLIASGVGALVLVYSSRYFKANASYLGRFGGIFLAFAGAMLGLVTTDNTIALYIYWELTTVFSFLLIGHYSERTTSRRAAVQAITVTTAGGLAMLAGIAILGMIPGGSFSMRELVDSALAGTLGPNQGTLVAAALALLLIGAFSKSALFPFHFWLPAAMAAPTPVSAYLHAAAMVKAGVYLIARLAPGFSGLPVWRWMVLCLASYTLLLGGFRALRQNDIKLVIAFGTVSQLGLIILFVGYGHPAMLLAGLMLILAHSLFKSALFLSVGIVDISTGTRDLRELSGVGLQIPAVAFFAALADASMIGLPPFAAFVAKEAALTHLWGSGIQGIIAIAIIATGSMLTVAYGIRFWWGAFRSKSGVPPTHLRPVSRLTVYPVVILSSAGLLAGLCTPYVGSFLEKNLSPYPQQAAMQSHLHLWGGFNGPLLLSVLIFAAGYIIHRSRHWAKKNLPEKLLPFSAENTYHHIVSGTERVSVRTTAATQSGSLPTYLVTIFIFTLGCSIAALVYRPVRTIVFPHAWDSWAQAAVAFIGCIGVLLAAASRHRMKAVILMGIGGYAVALTYELYGAPDLALTQVLSETLTLVVFVLVLRRLPRNFSIRRTSWVKARRIVLAVSTGLLFSGLAFLAAGVRTQQPISKLFAREGFSFGYGRNIVNVTLVDIRAWDTMGETAVLVVCAVGIASLLFVRDRFGGTDRLRNILGSEAKNRERVRSIQENPDAYIRYYLESDSVATRRGQNLPWLSSTNLPGAASRPLMLQIGTRMVFHSILVVSLFFLFAGHNMPGGGFAGGLLAGIALTLRYLAGGRFELGASMPVLPAHLLGVGLSLVTLSSLSPLLLGGAPLQTTRVDLTLPAFGDIHFTTALIFDIGVYLAVIGLVAEILRSLGGEIDRHGEAENIANEPEANLTPAADDRQAQRDEHLSEREMEERASQESEDERLKLARQRLSTASKGEPA